MNLIFSFDTEEYETPGVDDTVRIWADMLSAQGLRGCFCTVGEKARVLRDRGRRDIIDALAPHEIDFHSDWHSKHPVHAEYLEEMSWEAGVGRVLAEESRGLHDVQTILGSRPVAYCKPGASWGPQVTHAMARLGLPVFCDAPFEFELGRPLWYCGQLLIRYHAGFDDYFDTENRLSTMKRDFAALADRAGDGTIVLYTHPVRLFTSEWAHNFRYGVNTPREKWVPAPMRPKAEIDQLIRDFTDFVGWIVSEGISVIDYGRFHDRYITGARWVSLETAVSLADKSREAFTFHTVDGGSFSPAEAFGLVTAALAAFRRTGTLPAELPVCTPLGPVSRLDYAGDIPGLPAREILDSAAEVSDAVTAAGHVPETVVIRHDAVAPGAYLKAAADILVHLHRNGAPPETVDLDGTRIWPELAEREDIAGMRWGWSMLTPGFRGERVIEAARLQTWTAKPAVSC